MQNIIEAAPCQLHIDPVATLPESACTEEGAEEVCKDVAKTGKMWLAGREIG